MKHSIKRTIALVISLLLATQGTVSLPGLAFAENPDGEAIIIDGAEIESDIPIDDIELPVDQLGNLDCDLLSGDMDCNLTLGDLSFEELGANLGTLANGGESDPFIAAPFQKSAVVGDVTITVSAVAGAFPGDSVLRVGEVEDEDMADAVKRAAEAALQVEAARHHLYRIEVLDASENPCLPDADMELPLVRAEGLDLRDAAHVLVYDQNTDRSLELELTDGIQFPFVDSAIYDIVEVADAGEEKPVETPKQPADDAPSSDGQEPADVPGQHADDTPSSDGQESADVPGQPADDTPSSDGQESVDIPGQPLDDTPSSDGQEPVDVPGQPADDAPSSDGQESADVPGQPLDDTPSSDGQEPVDVPGQPTDDAPSSDGQESADVPGQPLDDTPSSDGQEPADIPGQPADDTPSSDGQESADVPGQPLDDTPSSDGQEPADVPGQHADDTPSSDGQESADVPGQPADDAPSSDGQEPADVPGQPADDAPSSDGQPIDDEQPADDAQPAGGETSDDEKKHADERQTDEEGQAEQTYNDTDTDGEEQGAQPEGGEQPEQPSEPIEGEGDKQIEQPGDAPAGEASDGTVDGGKADDVEKNRDESDQTEDQSDAPEGEADKPEDKADKTEVGSDASKDGTDEPEGDTDTTESGSHASEDGADEPEGDADTNDGESKEGVDKPEDETNPTVVESGTSEDEVEKPEEGEEKDESEETGDGVDHTDDETDGVMNESDTDEEEDKADEVSAAESHEATVDLSQVEAYPLSLRALLERVADEAAESVEAESVPNESESAEVISDEGEEARSEGAAMLPVSDWKIEYDETLLAIEFTGEDYLITPLTGFEAARVTVENGEQYVLTLENYRSEAEDQQAGEPEQTEVEEKAEPHEATVDLSQVEAYPLSLRALLERVADEAAESVEAESVPNESESAEMTSDEGEEARPEGAATLPASEWNIEYDATLLAIEFTGEDYLITPLTGFEATWVAVENGERYVLTLVNYAGEAQTPEEEAQPELREYAAEIDLSEVEAYPLSLRALMDMATPVANDEAREGDTAVAPQSDPASEGEGEQAAESEDESEASDGTEDKTEQTGSTTLDWTVEYDDALLAVEPAEDDYAVTPVMAFERAMITVGNGCVYRLTLCNYAPKVSYPEQSFEARTETMMVSVTAPEGAFPENTTMTVADVVDENTLNSITAAATGEAGENEVVEVQNIHAVDISFFNAAGEEIEPLLPISVNMAVIKAEPTAAQAPVVVHVDDAGEATVVDEQDAAGEEAAATFTADSFSVYALVMTTLEKTITASDGNTYVISVTYGHDAQVPAEAHLEVSEILSDSETYSDYHSQTQATLGWDDGVMGFARFFDISIVDENGDEVAVQALVSVKVELADRNSASISVVHFGEAPEVMDAQDDGEAVSFETAGFSVYAIVSSIAATDLDNRTFSIVNYLESMRAIGLHAEAKDSSKLQGTRVYVRPDVVGIFEEGVLFLANDQQLSRWTFEACSDSDKKNKYYLKTETEGGSKYLTLTDKAATLADAPDAEGWSELTVTKGTGEYDGKYFIANKNNSRLFLTGSLKDGFSFGVGKVSDERSWMKLLYEAPLSDEDIMLYSARKVDISNTAEVKNGDCLILYTRVWNEENLRYDYYLVDNNGKLVYCYEGGDEIQWFGSKINTAVWQFTEERLENSYDPNGYYELRSEQRLNNNQYAYIAPSLEDNKAFSYDSLSVHLPGRGNGSAYSKILRWDESADAFIGVKTENGRAVSCPMEEAEDFYFAWVYNKPTSEKLTTVSTLNNGDYGITMRMQDYKYQGHYVDGVYRQEDQSRVLVTDSDGEGIVSSTLNENGYPTAIKTGRSLEELYSKATTVNHLFLKSTYEESGYFEFDSTQNYAYLEDGVNFKVYEQLGTIDNSGGKSWDHGQFLPYNSLVGKHFTVNHVNTTDTLNHELSDLDPRKYEKMYGIKGGRVDDNKQPAATDADYFFGMEMEASFTQTEDGLDAWGHDIIFEFSGDDDFWLYVDGVLVLDLGGVHSAISGKINFRTGEVYNRDNDKRTLYDIFEAHYRKNNPNATEEDVAGYLKTTFKQDPKQDTWVFQDYSQHTLKLFYMERGASASNLHMRFNLAAARPNQIILEKEVTGLNSDAYNFAKFPYQVWYTTKDDPTGHYELLKNEDDKGCTVTYFDRNDPVEYKESFTPEGSARKYDHVFFLKSGESAAIRLPADTLAYYIVECGVDTETYDVVKVNNVVVPGDKADGNRKDFVTSVASPADRPKVAYNNHVDEHAVRTLTFTKKLYGPDGKTEIYDDPTTFAFCLSLGGEDEALDAIKPCNMKPYYVRDGKGNYCRWDVKSQSFVSLEVKNFDDLTDAEKSAAKRHTTTLGLIDKIPVDYTVEVRDLVPGVKFKVEEPDSEIPEGYVLMDYVRDNGGADLPEGESANMGAIRDAQSAHVIVRNQRGWGMTVKKVWSDADYMESHDAIYFAIYVDGKLLDGTVRQMVSTKGSSDTIYYYFDTLLPGMTFSDYAVYEVTLNGENESIAVVKDGVVTGYADDDITPISQDGTLEIGGTPVGGEHQTNYRYTVSYEVGEPEGGFDNVRTDTVTNGRPGISIYKRDMFDENVAGAVFTLKDVDGNDVGEKSYTSDDNGLITRAYLNKGDYTLEEVDAPRGYQRLSAPVTIRIGEDNSIDILDLDEEFYAVDADSAAIVIRNQSISFVIKKVDQATGEPIQGAVFALYAQLKDSDESFRKDYKPLEGCDKMITDADGIIPGINQNFHDGTYYLTETKPADGYIKLEKDLIFSIDVNGVPSIVSEDCEAWLTRSEDPETHAISYVLAIPNRPDLKKIQIRKVCSATQNVLAGAKFALYDAADFGDGDDPAAAGNVTPIAEGETDEQGLLEIENPLPYGEYLLVETKAPAGYFAPGVCVTVTVSKDGVSATRGGETVDVTVDVTEEGDVWTIELPNTPGVRLPNTGGTGTFGLHALGAMTVLLAALLLLRRKKAF